MSSYFNIISTVGKVIYPSLLWKVNIKEKVMYLTFDDGPIPVITPWVLNTLKEYNAKATFFCLGDNVAKNPDIFNMILNEGHVIGNHSHNHLNGWKTDCNTYVSNVLKAESVIGKFSSNPGNPAEHQSEKKFFRPPYGRISPSQISELERHEYKIIMWDVISGDYDQKCSANTCIRKVKRYAGPGSIIVFHDSIKAFKNLQKVLPPVLNFYTSEGFEFRSL